ncbi:unnamed protein product [Diatraea saccharalis]|uniref:Uncharacterized protein n=1 Tax=Diatraea saccharalis TaxID=40085 RepID=A0A9N9RGL2_9NEOP|nr:unnamed protein product [Diatraea saccharalis]
MKFLLISAALVAVAVAAPNRMFDPTQVVPNPNPIIIGGPAIIDQSPIAPSPIMPVPIVPSPIVPSPIVPSPVIIDGQFEPIQVGPAVIEHNPINPSPVVIQPTPTPEAPSSNSALVQIILNIQQ